MISAPWFRDVNQRVSKSKFKGTSSYDLEGRERDTNLSERSLPSIRAYVLR